MLAITRVARGMRQRLRIPRTIGWRWIVPFVFVCVSARYLAAYLAGPGSFGFDARLYAFVAQIGRAHV